MIYVAHYVVALIDSDTIPLAGPFLTPGEADQVLPRAVAAYQAEHQPGALFDVFKLSSSRVSMFGLMIEQKNQIDLI